MKTISELTDFYYKSLYPVLENLEEERKKLRTKIINIGIIYTVIVLVLTSLIFKHLNGESFIYIAVFYFATGAWFYKFFIHDYKDEFKQKVISPLIKEIDSNLMYAPDLHIPEANFTRSKLFTQRPDRVSGNDYVKGKIDNINIEFSDFHAEKKHKDSKGRTTWSTIFMGLFIVSDFRKNFVGETVILPDSAQSMFGNLVGNWLQANNFSRNQLVKMDDPNFEKKFVVYSTDQVEARYILSPTLMQKLLIYEKRSRHPLYVSFRHGKIYMALEYNEDLFEPSVFHSLLKYKIAMEYVSTLHLAIGVVEELKLNQKLWSKL